jgi:opacity protein-like surface antigen
MYGARGAEASAASRGSAVRWTGVILVLLAFVVGSGAAERADAEGNLGAHVAYTKAKDADDGNYLLGGHLELMLASFFGVQGAVDYRSEDRFITPEGEDGVRVRSTPVLLSGRLYVPGALPIRPFAEAGAGWYRVVYDYTEMIEALGLKDETVSTFGWHVGVGVNLPLAPTMFLTGNGRYVFADPERELDSEVRDEIRDLDYDSYSLGLGLSIGF